MKMYRVGFERGAIRVCVWCTSQTRAEQVARNIAKMQLMRHEMEQSEHSHLLVNKTDYRPGGELFPKIREFQFHLNKQGVCRLLNIATDVGEGLL